MSSHRKHISHIHVIVKVNGSQFNLSYEPFAPSTLNSKQSFNTHVVGTQTACLKCVWLSWCNFVIGKLCSCDIDTENLWPIRAGNSGKVVTYILDFKVQQASTKFQLTLPIWHKNKVYRTSYRNL